MIHNNASFLVYHSLFVCLHLSSSSVFSGVRVTRSFFLYVCFVERCLSFCLFFFSPFCGIVILYNHVIVCISPLIRYTRGCGSYQDFLYRGLLTMSYWTKGSSWLNWSHHFESFTVATMTWLTVMEYLCYKWPRTCSTCRKHFPVLCSVVSYHRVRY